MLDVGIMLRVVDTESFRTSLSIQENINKVKITNNNLDTKSQKWERQ